QRQGRIGGQPHAVDQSPGDQGDVRAAHRPPLPAPGVAVGGRDRVMLRTALLLAARSPRCRALVERAPLTRGVVARFVAGTTLEEVLPVVRRLTADRLVTLDHLGEDVTDAERAADTVDAYVRLLAELGVHGLAERAEVSVKLSALGLALP